LYFFTRFQSNLSQFFPLVKTGGLSAELFYAARVRLLTARGGTRALCAFKKRDWGYHCSADFMPRENIARD
jgi:hypothetical protein